MSDKLEWYEIEESDQIDSPALVIYKDRVIRNLEKMISLTCSPERLMPHVKTHKMEEIVKLQLSLGIRNFKCATIAEAEMVGSTGADSVLIALQPVGPKFSRLIQLIRKFPRVDYSVIVDNEGSAAVLNQVMVESGLKIGVYLDLNVGMNRTGIIPGEKARELIEKCNSFKGIVFKGIHAYDGHNTLLDYQERKTRCEREYAAVNELIQWGENRIGKKLSIISGGTPTFPIHAENRQEICSPGTTVLWDESSQVRFPDIKFDYAAVLLTRIISIVGQNLICLDLGHKAVAAETPLPRVRFLNHPEAIPVSQSEEHLIVQVPEQGLYKVGDLFYGVPWHICPTCALYQEVSVIEGHHVQEHWVVSARNRTITV